MFRKLKSTKIQLLIIIILTFLAYSNIFANAFVIDDPKIIVEWTTKNDLRNIPKIFTGEEAAGINTRYRPIGNLFFMLAYQIFGVNPFGYHIVSILVHLASTVLIYFIIRHLRGGHWLPFVTALLFGLHPIHTEAITFITIGVYSTGAVFLLASFYLYLFYEKTSKPVFYACSLSLGIVAMLIYEAAVVLPLLIMLYGLCFKQKIKFFSSIKYYIGYLVPVLIFIAHRFIFLQHDFVLSKYSLQGLYHAQLLMSKIYAFYIYLMVLPLWLSINHIIADGVESFSPVSNDLRLFFKESIFGSGVFLSILSVVVLVIIAIKFFKKTPIISFSIGWFFLSLLPFANLTPQLTPMAERYLYIPSFGFVLFLGLFFREVIRRVRLVGLIGLIGLLACYLVLTYRRNFDWKNDETLWQKVVKIYPNSALGYYSIGAIYNEQKKYDIAIIFTAKAISLKPNFYQARYNLAYANQKIGNLYQAQEQYKKAIEINPDFASAYINLANIYRAENPELAIKLLSKAIKISSKEDLSIVYRNLGFIYKDRKEFDLAFLNFKKALVLDPSDSIIRQELLDLININPQLSNENP